MSNSVSKADTQASVSLGLDGRINEAFSLKVIKMKLANGKGSSRIT
ncbi:MAG: hypothetical protein ACE5H7_13520 [Acidiferrobacterales bacterium]